MEMARWRDSGDSEEGLVALDGRLVDGCGLELEALTGGISWSPRIVSKDRVEGTRQDTGRSEPIAFAITAPFDCTAGP
jgi:hypothetical protein